MSPRIPVALLWFKNKNSTKSPTSYPAYNMYNSSTTGAKRSPKYSCLTNRNPNFCKKIYGNNNPVATPY